MTVRITVLILLRPFSVVPECFWTGTQRLWVWGFDSGPIS